MRGLMAAVIGMGILIVAGVTVLVVVMVQRMSAPPAAIASATASAPAVAVALTDEPAGTRIAGLSLAGDRVAVQLAGGGPDRIVVVDFRTGRVVAHTGLAR